MIFRKKHFTAYLVIDWHSRVNNIGTAFAWSDLHNCLTQNLDIWKRSTFTPGFLNWKCRNSGNPCRYSYQPSSKSMAISDIRKIPAHHFHWALIGNHVSNLIHSWKVNYFIFWREPLKPSGSWLKYPSCLQIILQTSQRDKLLFMAEAGILETNWN